MFDVDWSDPNRESVGDRRTRKQKEREKGRDADDDRNSEDQAQKTDGHEGGSSRASESLRSSVSSIEKQFGFFGAKNRKKGSSRKGKSKSVASSSLRAPTIDEQLQNEQGLLDLPSNFSSSKSPFFCSLCFPGLQYTVSARCSRPPHPLNRVCWLEDRRLPPACLRCDTWALC